jgi:hypothetical protein
MSRDFSKFSTDNFISDLSSVDWDQCFIYSNVDRSFSYFYNPFNNCVNKHAPVKLISKRKVECPTCIEKRISILRRSMYYFHSKDFEKRFKWTGIGSISIDPSKINDAIMKQNSAKIS